MEPRCQRISQNCLARPLRLVQCNSQTLSGWDESNPVKLGRRTKARPQPSYPMGDVHFNAESERETETERGVFGEEEEIGGCTPNALTRGYFK